ncbi:hypothetical protein ACVBEQ_10735 [Nakamurella sp. GG22]
MEFTYRMAMLMAEREFVASLVDRLGRGELGGQDLWVRMHEQLAQGRSPADLAQEMAHHLASRAAEQAVTSG